MQYKDIKLTDQVIKSQELHCVNFATSQARSYVPQMWTMFGQIKYKEKVLQ